MEPGDIALGAIILIFALLLLGVAKIVKRLFSTKQSSGSKLAAVILLAAVLFGALIAVSVHQRAAESVRSRAGSQNEK